MANPITHGGENSAAPDGPRRSPRNDLLAGLPDPRATGRPARAGRYHPTTRDWNAIDSQDGRLSEDLRRRSASTWGPLGLQVACIAAALIGWLLLGLHRNPVFFLVVAGGVWLNANRAASKRDTRLGSDQQLAMGFLTVLAVVLAIVMLVNPSPLAHRAASTGRPVGVYVGNGDQPVAPVVPALPTANAASDQAARLAAWDARIPATAPHQPALADSNVVWQGDAEYWLHSTYDHGEVWYADGVIADTRSPLYPQSTASYQRVPSFVTNGDGQWVQGGPGDADRVFRGTVQLNDGTTSVVTVAFHYVTDASGRGHILLSIIESGD